MVFAWWGVNQLNVGLHSYGFTSGIFWVLVGVGIAEAVVIGLGILVSALGLEPERKSRAA